MTCAETENVPKRLSWRPDGHLGVSCGAIAGPAAVPALALLLGDEMTLPSRSCSAAWAPSGQPWVLLATWECSTECHLPLRIHLDKGTWNLFPSWPLKEQLLEWGTVQAALLCPPVQGYKSINTSYCRKENGWNETRTLRANRPGAARGISDWLPWLLLSEPPGSLA